jgi:hypothetical protein
MRNSLGKVHSSLIETMVSTCNKSVGRDMEGLSVVNADLSAFLHPSKIDNVQQGVLELLSSLLLQYDEIYGVVSGSALGLVCCMVWSQWHL